MRIASALTGALLLLVSVAACGQNKYQYVSNDAENTFFKVPSQWETFTLTESDKDGRAAALPIGPQQIWHVGFDAASDPDAAHLDELAPASLVGDVYTYALPSSDNDQMSLSQLRSLVFLGVDPVLQSPGTPARWEVVSYTDIVGTGGANGSRVVINVPVDEARTEWVTIDGSTLFDPTTQRLHVLQLRCEAQCYEQHRSAADDIAASWKVNP